ncbi:MAG: AAA family ATPase, partial [Pseudanabaenales cyanobacterium]|nr:AAA family ATPase [Pseudanabaenales cyanobacterium]
SVLGLIYDLERCCQQWEVTREITLFELGEQERCDRFIIPEKLYGRETEVQTLLAAFERVANGATEMMLVAGFSGIGKTAVVSEVHKPITRQKGYFIQGKFDQFNRNVPFSAFVQAFRSLMGQLLGESDAALATWKEKILDAMGANGQVILEVIPELERIIDKQPVVPKLSGSAAQNRFNLLFGRFVRVFTSPEHPLVIFLDDLQWADSASLNLLKLLMNESVSGYLLVLGSYRDNEVYLAHPLMLALDEIGKQKAHVNTLTLKPLEQFDINQLVADTLLCPTDIAAPFSQLVYQKTQGNPFFVTQFLTGLYEDSYISFDLEVGHWQCDLNQVRQLALTDDVVEFMVNRLRKLPPATQNVLKLAACIGNHFDLEILSVVNEAAQDEVALDLWQALQEGLLIPESETYKFFQEHETPGGRESLDVSVSYRFLHDRVQQAAYSLIGVDHIHTSHLTIGRRLLQASSETLDKHVFQIVNQFNRCFDIVTAPDEILTIAKLNLLAAAKARETTAFLAAKDYAQVGIQLLGPEAWQTDYDLMLGLRNCAAEAAYLSGSFDQMTDSIHDILNQAVNLEDQLQAYEVKLQALKAQNEMQEALSLGLEILKLLQISLPAAATAADIEQAYIEMTTALAGRALTDLIYLPDMSDRLTLASTRILAILCPVAHMIQFNLLPILLFRQVQLALRYGNAPAHTHAYAGLGLILCGVRGEIEKGYEAGQLALALLEQIEAEAFRSAVTFIVAYFILPWKTSIQSTFELMLEAYTSGANTGDLEHAAYAVERYGQLAYFSGAVELSDLAAQMGRFDEFLRKTCQGSIRQLHDIHYQVVLNWQRESCEPSILAGEVYDESIKLPQQLKQNNRLALVNYYLNKLILTYGFTDDSKLMREYAAQAEHYLSAGSASIVMPLFYTYDSLARLRRYEEVSLNDQQEYLTTVEANQAKLRDWAKHASMNYLHKYNCVEAERRRVLGRSYEAADEYDRSIAGAKANGYLQDEALANELAAKFYLAWGREKLAQVYMSEAHYAYSRWGATAKVKQLEEKYPNLLTQ